MNASDTQPARIVIADNDAAAAKLLRETFEDGGFAVSTAQNAAEVMTLLDGLVTLVTLDLKLAHADGLDVIRTIRQATDVPIVVVTARASKVSEVVAFEVGADDYVTKPFDADVLMARVRAILRRSRRSSQVSGFAEAQQPALQNTDSVVFDDWRFDIAGHRLWSPEGTPVELTAAEIELLSIFVRTPRHPLSRAEIAKHLRGDDDTSTERSIDVLVGRLRRKLDKHAGGVEIIKTLRGSGYLFCVEIRPATAAR